MFSAVRQVAGKAFSTNLAIVRFDFGIILK